MFSVVVLYLDLLHILVLWEGKNNCVLYIIIKP
jgi:hypothetical protein